MKFFSITIPTYEMKGLGVEYLEHSFNILNTQTFKDFEIVVSDHSVDDVIKSLCEKWSGLLDIKYHKNENKRGNSSANLNNAISNSSGKWIKVLFQDDFLFDKDSLNRTHNFILNNPDTKWVVTACEHSNDGYNFYRTSYPKWNNQIQFGDNTISSPSVLCIENTDDKIYFDEQLIWLMDVEYYKRMYDKFGGEPSYINEVSVVNRTWGSQLSNTIPDEVKLNEFEIVKNKYKKEFMEIKTEKLFNALCNLNFERSLLYQRGIVDINEHLPTLREYASKCEHVTEMGTRYAISTFALLIGRPKKVVSIDMNYKFFQPYEGELNAFAEECGTEFEFIESDVLKMDIDKTDMLFIDTLHTYNQLSKELRKHEGSVNKWIILHDTITFGQVDEGFYQNGEISDEISNQVVSKRGLYTALIDFLEENKNWKIKEHFTNNNGLTVIERC